MTYRIRDWGLQQRSEKSLLLEKNAWGEVGGHSQKEQYQDDFEKVLFFPIPHEMEPFIVVGLRVLRF